MHFLLCLVSTPFLPGFRKFLVIMSSSGSNEKRGDNRNGDEDAWKREIKGNDGTLGSSVVSDEEPVAPLSQPLSATVTGISAIPATWISTGAKAPRHRLAPKSSFRLYKNPYYNRIHSFGVENTSRLDLPGPWDHHLRPKRGN